LWSKTESDEALVVSINDDRNLNERLETARHMLRLATHDIHERLHRHPALVRLAAGTIKKDEYRLVLARSYGFYAMAEPALGLSGQSTANLRADLADLDMRSSECDALPRCAPFALGQELPELIGGQYVLLGASLGGTVMARAIARHTDGYAALPVRFLTAMDNQSWTRFSADLEYKLSNVALRARASRAAATVFAAYEDWMTWHE
jgi:heme oxygenase